MKEIQLTQGKVALVDDEDFERLNQKKWCAFKNGNTFYAARIFYGGEKQKTILMHREIMNTPQGVEVDHKDGDGLNNQKCNLRNCDHFQNSHNQSRQSNNKSGFKGVSKDKNTGKWAVNIKINNKQIHIGCFKDLKDAALAYDKAALKYHGDFARLNFPHLSHLTGQDSSTPAAHLDASGTRPILSIGGQPKGLSEVAES